MRKVLLTGLLFSTATLTFATNGDNLIGLTPASRSMGGIGVGIPVGPVDSVFRNPAWMSVMKDRFNVQFGGILFMPRVKAKMDTDSTPPSSTGEKRSKVDIFVVPEIGIVHRINSRLIFGLGAFGVSGMGVDYRNVTDASGSPAFQNMHTTFQFMRIIPAIAFRVNKMITVSGAIHGAWGSLDMGQGQSQTLGMGAQVGASFNFEDFLYGGVTYQTSVPMTYKRVFDFDCYTPGGCDGTFEDFKLEQPQEFAVGLGVVPFNSLKAGIDARWINWKDAKGYKKFGWKDQWVIALGAEYKPTEKLSLRAGYNYGRSPIRGGNLTGAPATTFSSSGGGAVFTDDMIAFFNLIGFPAITEHHITLGVGYEFTKTFGVDFSYVHAFNKKVESSGLCAGLTGSMSGGPYNCSISAENAQNSLSAGLNWRF